MKLKAIFVHRDSGEFMENRFDTLMMVNGSIASLLTIAKHLGVEAVAIDESYPGGAKFQELIHQQVEECLRPNWPTCDRPELQNSPSVNRTSRSILSVNHDESQQPEIEHEQNAEKA